jgi:hypothetical protein
MKNKQVLPIPFLILILAGVVSLFSIAATRKSRVGMTKDDPLQMQTVEQERVAAIYFRILSWLSDVTPRPAGPVKANPQPAPVPPVGKTPRRRERRSSVELCTFHSTQSLTASKRRASNLD